MEFLGKKLNKDGIRPLKKHVDAIERFPEPRTKKQLQRFLGLIAWVSCFIHNYSQNTQVLTALLAKDAEFVWLDEHQAAFDRLRSLVTQRCINYHPDFSAPFYLASDVCKDGYY